MKKTIIIASVFILILAGWSPAKDLSKNSCIQCHQTLDEKHAKIVNDYKADIHYLRRIGCEGCHGGDARVGFQEGDPMISMDPAKGYVGVPAFAQIPRFCGKCHSDVEYMKQFNPGLRVDQEQQYRTSVHAKQLAKGDTNVATCINCHGVHGILSVSDTRSPVHKLNIPKTCAQCHSNKTLMAGYKISSDQFELYQKSVHGILLLEKNDRSAPTCADCHGNHGATPPGLVTVSQVCGECHASNRDLFSESPHKQAFAELNLPECEACHGNHAVQAASVELIGIDEKAKCTECHDTESNGYAAAFQIRATIDSLAREVDLAQAMRSKAQKAGVEVRDENMSLVNAKNALIQVEAIVHTFSVAKVEESAKEGFKTAEEAKQIGQNALEEVGRRRKLLAVMVVMTLLVAGLLVLYIREREKKRT